MNDGDIISMLGSRGPAYWAYLEDAQNFWQQPRVESLIGLLEEVRIDELSTSEVSKFGWFTYRRFRFDLDGNEGPALRVGILKHFFCSGCRLQNIVVLGFELGMMKEEWQLLLATVPQKGSRFRGLQEIVTGIGQPRHNT